MALDSEAAAFAVVSFLIAALPFVVFVLAFCLLVRSIAGRYTTKILIALITTGFGNGALGLAYFLLSGEPKIISDDSGFFGRLIQSLDPTLIRDMLYGSYLALATALGVSYAKRLFGRHLRLADDEW